jgi:hypothetical protein
MFWTNKLLNRMKAYIRKRIEITCQGRPTIFWIVC